MAARIERRAARAAQRRADRVPRSGQPHRPHRTSPSRTRATAQFAGSEIPARPAAAVDPGHRAGRQAARAGRAEHPQRRLRAAVGRRWLDVRRRGRARPGVDDVARQPAEPASWRSPAIRSFLKVAEQVAGEMNRWAQELLRPRRSSTTGGAARLHDADLPRPRPAPRRSPRAPTPTAPASRPRSSTPRCTSSTTTSALREPRLVARALPAEDPDGRGSGALERHPGGARAHLGLPVGTHQDLRARRADRGVLPADGDPRRARRRTSSASTPAAGTTSTACRTRWPGIRRSSTRTSTPSR